MTRLEAQKQAKSLASIAVSELADAEAVREFYTNSDEEWGWLRDDFHSIARRLADEGKRVKP